MTVAYSISDRPFTQKYAALSFSVMRCIYQRGVVFDFTYKKIQPKKKQVFPYFSQAFASEY